MQNAMHAFSLSPLHMTLLGGATSTPYVRSWTGEGERRRRGIGTAVVLSLPADDSTMPTGLGSRSGRLVQMIGGRIDSSSLLVCWYVTTHSRLHSDISLRYQSLGAGLAPALIWPSIGVADQRHLVASSNLAQARQEAREFGRERRAKIRRRVRETKQRSCEELDDEAVRPDGPCRRGSHRH